MINPCLRCGACCAFFRASFYWAEADDAPGGRVPAALTVQVNAMQRAMRGTDKGQPRCCALQGEIGQAVSCAIHPLRASPCREFTPSWENQLPNPQCDKARLAWGMAPLSPDDWCGDCCVA